MSSFFEKLKKGMGSNLQSSSHYENDSIKDDPSSVEEPSLEKEVIMEEEIKNDLKNESEKEIPEESKTKEKQASKKKREQKLKIKTKTEKTNKETKEEKEEVNSDRKNFALKNLGGQEGQLAIDVYQTEKEIIVQSTIAGVKPNDIDISIQIDGILIKGSRKQPFENEEKNYFYQECYWGPFSRQVVLPNEIDLNRAIAEMKEGILTIKIPKIEKEQKKKIEIRG